MGKSFKQVSTGLTLVCNREDVIRQYEKYPELYIPLDKPAKKPVEAARTEADKPADDKTPEKK